jgi:hypothetical protein
MTVTAGQGKEYIMGSSFIPVSNEGQNMLDMHGGNEP